MNGVWNFDVVNGPEAINVIALSSIVVTSWSIKVTFELFVNHFVIYSENWWRSTANAPPSGTRLAYAALIINESNANIYCFNNPTPFVKLSLRNEFEQTNSANEFCFCTGFLLTV